MPLKPLGNEQGWLKAGFLGYQKSGKSYTAAKLAIGVRAFFKHPGPIAMFDTESGSGYIAEMVRAETGKDLMGVRARSFADLMQFTQDCIAEKVSVGIVDSITHPWRELCDSYLAQLNVARKARDFSPLSKMEFQHWAAVKGIWEPWPTFYLNSPIHLIVCGRAGAIWEMEKNEETNRRELVQTGTKMKVEGEFGFEPSLLVEMEREQIPDGHGGFKLIHRATVLGDRFNVLDGRTEVNPSFEFFLPHVQKLKPGAHAPVDTQSKTVTGADMEGHGDWEREKKSRTILCEEIQGILVSTWPGMSAEEKKHKADTLAEIFGTRSWTKVEGTDSRLLRNGLAALKVKLGIHDLKEPEPVPPTNALGIDEEEGEFAPKNPAPEGAIIDAPKPWDKGQKQPAAIDHCLLMRAVCQERKVKESEVTGALKELGRVDTFYATFEDLKAKEPKAFEELHESLGGVISAILEARK